MEAAQECVFCTFRAGQKLRLIAGALYPVCRSCWMIAKTACEGVPPRCLFDWVGNIYAGLQDQHGENITERFIRLNDRAAAGVFQRLCGCPDCVQEVREVRYA